MRGEEKKWVVKEEEEEGERSNTRGEKRKIKVREREKVGVVKEEEEEGEDLFFAFFKDTTYLVELTCIHPPMSS